MDEERWVPVDAVASHLDVSRDTVYRWMRGKRLPAHRIGRVWRFKLSEIDEWVKDVDSAHPKSKRSGGERG
ncbi:MAG: helix-turn-helix domain-containing protein [Planctomycetes bacterium]|nr:helix-turn-helix domain-containing protein [Planctomycetota bacterium]